MTSEHSSQSSSAPGDVFATTHWTVVLAAGRRSATFTHDDVPGRNAQPDD